MNESNVEFYNLAGTNKKDGNYSIVDIMGDIHMPMDELLSEIDLSLVSLHYFFQKKIFPNCDYLENLSFAPIWLSESGIDTELSNSKIDFEYLINNESNETYNKLLLVKDFEILITNIQDRIVETRYLFITFYREFNKLLFTFSIENPDSTYFLSGKDTILIFSLLENLFVKLYSILDLFAKLYVERDAIYDDFTKWPNMKSKGVLFGDSNKFDKTVIRNTIFDINDNIKLLLNLRHDIIHNGTFMYQNKIYFSYKNNELVEKFILMMDNHNGIIDKVKNRNRFYNNDIKLNYYLPDFYSKIIERIYNTIKIF